VPRGAIACGRLHTLGLLGRHHIVALLATHSQGQRLGAQPHIAGFLLDIDGIADSSMGIRASRHARPGAHLSGRQRAPRRNLAKIFASCIEQLIWNYWVSNYLMGQKPSASTSSTGMPTPRA
jgi:hypothetical protein